MTIADAKDGDIVTIGDETYRLMIMAYDAWGCRRLLEDGAWSTTYTWFRMDVGISEVVKEANPGKPKGSTVSIDPLMRR